MLGLGSSIVNSSRSYSEIITLYEQESFSTVGDWTVVSSTGSHDVSDSTVTAGETAPGSSNNDWLKVYYAQDYVSLSYDPVLRYNQNVIADLGGAEGDYVSLEAEVYLDGPWGTSGNGNRQLFLQWSGYTASDLFIPTDQETTVSTGAGANFPTGSFSSDDVFEIRFSVPLFVVKAGCSMYLRNIKITAERY